MQPVELKKTKLIKYLSKKKKKKNGKNNSGIITVRHKGGGHKQKYRIISFLRKKEHFGHVSSIEYDPNRTAFIAKIFNTKKYFFIICPENLKIGDFITSNIKTTFNIGNSFSLKNIPLGYLIHNISLQQNQKGQLLRSAGTFGQLITKKKNYVIIRLNSGFYYKINSNCSATIGVVSNKQNFLKKKKKAGNNRWKNIRPTVRGVAMNPIDHPHGGGEGKTSGGRCSVSPWGRLTKGKKTKKKNV